MESFNDILDRASSRYRSTAAPWRDHTGQSSPLGSIPTETLGGGTDWRAQLGIEDPVQESLDTARARYDTLKAQADAVGEGGDGPLGLLSALGRTLDIPRAAVFSAGKEVADMLGGGDDASWSDYNEQFNERMGFGDTGILQYDEDDEWYQRAGKAVGAFVGDVVTDPVTYLTFGAGSVGVKSMSAIVKSTVSSRAKNLGDDALQAFGEKSLRWQAADKLGQHADDLDEEVVTTLNFLKSQDSTLEGAASHLGAEASEAYLREGAGGLRRFLQDEFGDDGKALFDSLPDDVKGGIRLRIPFAYSDEGVKKAVPLRGTAGGQLQEALGLTRVTSANRRLMNRMRSGRAAQTLSATFGGAHGDLYGKMLADIIRKDPDDMTRFSYHQYDAVTRAFSKARRASQGVTEISRQTMGMAHYYLDSTPGKNGPKMAKQAFDRYAQDPAEVRELREATGLYLDEAGKYHFTDDASAFASSMPEAEVRGLAAAMLWHDTLAHLLERAKASGLTIGEINDYVPRAITDKALENRIAMKAGASKASGRGGGAYDPTASRKFFREFELFVDEKGETQWRLRDLTPDEINARVKEAKGLDEGDLFETDPFMMLAKYADGLASVVYRTHFAKLIQESGGVIQAGTSGRSLYSANAVRNLLNQDVEPSMYGLKRVRATTQMATASRETLLSIVGAIGQAEGMKAKAELTGILAKGLREVAKDLDELKGSPDFATLVAKDKEIINDARFALRRAADKADNARIKQMKVDTLGALLGPAGLPERELTETVEEMATAAIEVRLTKPQLKWFEDQVGNVYGIDFAKSGSAVRLDREAADELAARLAADPMDAGAGVLSKTELANAQKFRDRILGKLSKSINETPEEELVERTVTRDAEAIAGLGLDKLGNGRHVRTLPPELAETYAPEMMRIATEKFYRASTPDNALQEWIDRTYRPYLSIFKTMATVGRGVGFHVRNLVGGGLWNNYLIDVSPKDSKIAATIVRARVKAGAQARKEAAEEMAKLRGITLAQAKHEISPTAVEARTEVLLRDMLETQPHAHGKTLYDVHRLSKDNGVDWRQGEQSELSESMRRVEELGEGATARERAKAASGWVLFPDDDPSFLQRQANRLAGGPIGAEGRLGKAADQASRPFSWWVRTNGNVAERSESFMRLAAFSTGLRRYGFEDSGEMAALLPKATQFDYRDLSDFERKWLRGFAIPFYTWQRNNIPLQFRALIHEPGKVQRLMHAVDNMQDQYGDEDQELLPEWMRERLGFATNITFDGSPLIVGAESPATALNQFFKVGDGPGDTAAGFGREVVSSLSPVIQGPLQYATGYDFFTGSDILPEDRNADLVDTMLPWASMGRKWAGIAGHGDDERQARTATELIRQLAPVVSVSTLTPRQELGMLYGEQDRLAAQIAKHPDLVERAKFFLELGLPPERVAEIVAR